MNILKLAIDENEERAVVDAIRSGQIAQGKRVAEFEEKFSEYCGSKYAIAVSNGTAALHTALFAADVKSGDLVVTTPFTFIATANSILMQGARPVFVDIDPVTFNLDVNKVEQHIVDSAKAILTVDLYGLMTNYNELNSICKRHGIVCIEDAAQSVGASYSGKRAGGVADLAAFSFYATKNLTTGEGGMVTTNNEEYAKKMRSFRHHGQGNEAYLYSHLAYNYRMTDIEASIGLCQLKKLENNNAARRSTASYYIEYLKSCPDIVLPTEPQGSSHVYHQFTIRVLNGKRDELAKFLSDNGVPSRVYYPSPVYFAKHFHDMGYKKGLCPIAEKTCAEVLSLPIYPNVPEEDMEKIMMTIRKFYGVRS